MHPPCYVDAVNATDADELAATCARLDRALARLRKAEQAYRDGVVEVRGRYGRGIVTAIARHLGVHRTTIARFVGATPHGPGGAELTDADKALLTRLHAAYAAADAEANGTDGAYAARATVLRKLYDNGVGPTELARAAGASETTISDIVNAAHRGGGRTRTARPRSGGDRGIEDGRHDDA